MNINKLVKQCQDGDREALGVLYTTYYNKLLKICSHYISDENAAKDILHDGFIVIFSSIKGLKSPERLEYWMGIIIKNLALRYLTNKSKLNITTYQDINEEKYPDIENTKEEIPSFDELQGVIKLLPNGYQTIFKLSVFEGLSHKEIAEQIGIEAHSSSSQLYRAKVLLKKLLLERHYYIAILILFAIPIWITILYFTKEEKKQTYSKATITKKHKKRNTLTKLRNYNHISTTNISLNSLVSSLYSETKDTIITDTKDSIPEKEDNNVSQEVVKQEIANNNKQRIEDNYTPNSIPLHSPEDKNTWSLALKYINMNGSSTNTEETSGFTSVDLPKNTYQNAHHNMPISASIVVNKEINNKISVETGIRYTYLKSHFTTISNQFLESEQRIHYIGIPLNMNYNLYKKSRFAVYSSIGLALDIPVSYKNDITTIIKSEFTTISIENKYVPLQWSVNTGIGIQYSITSNIFIYVEPNINYYFNNGSSIKTTFTDNPFKINIPVGIRFNW